MLRKFVLVFFDDILVYSKDWNSHMKHLKEVLWILENHGVVANKKKCHRVFRACYLSKRCGCGS
jgi:hypothetical protein